MSLHITTVPAGAVTVCAFGDLVIEGQAVVLVNGCWYHEACHRNGRASA